MYENSYEQSACSWLRVIDSVIGVSCDKTGFAERGSGNSELLAQERSAHFNRSAAQFVMDFSDSMISVNKGRVAKQSVENYRKKFQSYFDNVEFHAWDDMEQPHISFSDEGSLAYAIVAKNVIVTHFEKSDTTEFAWVSIYRKLNGEWKLECNVSTNK
jgi:hypothetical protein